MLSRPVSRAACAPGPFVASSAFLKSPTAVPRVSQNRPQHRRSSSKTSYPPGSNPPAARGSTGAPKDSSSDGVAEKGKTNGSNPSRRKSRSFTSTAEGIVQKARDEALINVPAVQPTSHLNLADVKLFSLFALHRPISIDPRSAYPPATTNKSFNALFTPPKASSVSYEAFTVEPVGPSHTAYTHEEADGLHFSIIQNSSSNAASSEPTPSEGPVDLDQLSRRYRPFHTPPAPVPFDSQGKPQFSSPSHSAGLLARSANKTSDRLRSSFADATESPRSERAYTTTLTIREATNAAGDKTYTASASPITEHHEPPPSSRSTMAQTTRARQPFLTRMHARSLAIGKDRRDRADALSQAQETEGEADSERADAEQASIMENEENDEANREMLLISVKRQRKLKMKKHKYKKLMRRTRNLRRREGRL